MVEWKKWWYIQQSGEYEGMDKLKQINNANHACLCYFKNLFIYYEVNAYTINKFEKMLY